MSETSKCGNCGHPVHHEHTDGICGTMTYMADGSDEWDEDLFCYCATYQRRVSERRVLSTPAALLREWKKDERISPRRQPGTKEGGT